MVGLPGHNVTNFTPELFRQLRVVGARDDLALWELSDVVAGRELAGQVAFQMTWRHVQDQAPDLTLHPQVQLLADLLMERRQREMWVDAAVKTVNAFLRAQSVQQFLRH